MAGQQVAGILHMHRALEGGFEQVAQLGEGIEKKQEDFASNLVEPKFSQIKPK